MGADILFTTGAFAGVATAMLILSFFVKQGISSLEQFNFIFASFTAAAVLLGFLFKVMHWPGAAKLIWVADIGIVLSGILLLVDGIREKDPVRSMWKILMMFFILFLFLLILLVA